MRRETDMKKEKKKRKKREREIKRERERALEGEREREIERKCFILLDLVQINIILNTQLHIETDNCLAKFYTMLAHLV